MRWLPGVATLREYQRSWLRHDLVAGLVLVTMLVPVGIAYAVASGVPGVYGLYATIVPLLAYARVRAEPHPRAGAGLVARGHHPGRRCCALSGGDPMRAIALAGAMAIVSGLICILAGVLRLGFVTELFSKPIRYGYMNGIALTVLISQLPKLFGFSVESDGPLRSLWAIGEAVWTGRTNWTAFAVGAAHARDDPAAQGEQAPAGRPDRRHRRDRSSSACSISRRRAGVAVLGPLPQGLPAFAHSVDRAVPTSCRCLIGGLAVALVSFADTSVLSRAYAARTRSARRSQPGDGGPGRRQPRRRFLPGLSDQQQLVAHAGRGSRRRQDAGHGRRRRAGRRRCCSSRRPICCGICRSRRWPPSSSPRRSG